MREILYRAKAINRIEDREYCTNYKNGDWVYGLVTKIYDERFPNLPAEMTNTDGISEIDVDYKTISEYTGLTDKNGTKIFEGDIIKNDWCFMKGNSIIRFGEYKSFDMNNDYRQGHLGFYIKALLESEKKLYRKDILYYADKCEVIGNIHDNPELLKGD